LRLKPKNRHKEFYRKLVNMKIDFENGSAYLGDALEVVKSLESDSVDSVITSPPYYQLRDYGFTGQWGLENDYKDYLNKMVELMSELKRILKPTGTMWINLGDTYMNNSSYCEAGRQGFGKDKIGMLNKKDDKILHKSLMLIPHRFAIRCIDEIGLILRNDIIWAKPNAMPESVTDRFSKKHEFVFFFVKNQEYYFDLDSVRDKLTYPEESLKPFRKSCLSDIGLQNGKHSSHSNPNGKNPGDVSDFWEITTKPNSKNHYATYNSELIRKPLIAGSPVGGIILDPFGGTGTTCFSAVQFDRRFIYIDANKEYYDNFVKEMSYQDSHYKLNFDSDLQKVG
jgi:DNA modification methylase